MAAQRLGGKFCGLNFLAVIPLIAPSHLSFGGDEVCDFGSLRVLLGTSSLGDWRNGRVAFFVRVAMSSAQVIDAICLFGQKLASSGGCGCS